MNTKKFFYYLVGLVMIVALGCSSSDETFAKTEKKVFITDRTGRKWDITHAKNTYNMRPEYFNFGIGVGAIPSVDDPKIVDKGSAGYPKSTSRVPVFGVNHNGEQRAYGVGDMARHEIFNEKYPGESDQHVAVGY